LAQGSRRTMQQALNSMASLLTSGRIIDALVLDWSQLRYPHTAALRSFLAEKYSAATVNKMLSALRGVLKAAWRLGLISAEDRERACDVAAVTGERLPRGRSLAPGEIRALIQDCGQDASTERILGVRDAALMALLYGCGLRRAELVTLDTKDMQNVGGEISLVVRGKRNKERLVPVAGGAADALADWLILRGTGDGALFTPYRKGGKREDRRMTTQAIYHICKDREKRSGVAPFSPHDFRRTFVGDLLDHGADIVTVQKLAGHANVTTTARYDRRGERAKRKAAELLHVPYTPTRR
ncbi:MAG: integrase, partial [Proteobacteria bacterium]